MPTGVVSPHPTHKCVPHSSCAGSCGPGWGTPLQRELQRHLGEMDLPSSQVSPSWGEWGSVPSLLSPAPVAAMVGQRHSAGGIGGDSSAGRRWKHRQGRSQLAEDQALVVGRHVHLEAQSRAQGCTPARAAPQHHLPSSPGTARWPQPAPAAAPCPAAPRRDSCGEGGVGHPGDTPPQTSPISQGHPRLGGCPQAWLILKDHAGRELPAAAGGGQRGQDGSPGA